MNNIKYTITALLLMGTMLVGCKEKTSETEESSVSEGPEIIEGRFIVDNGLSTYYVVTPRNPMERETTAAQEFTYFMKQATGCDLPLITEREVRRNYHYVSLGATEQFNAAFPDFDWSRMEAKESTYFISTKDDNIYIVSGKDFNGDAVCYGVYDLLHDLIDYRYYHDSEICFEHTNVVPLVRYRDVLVEPSFDARSISTLYTMCDDNHTRRLRLINNSRGFEWSRKTYGHGQITKFIAPWDLDENGIPYGQSHPDWFAKPGMPDPHLPDGSMIDNSWCYTAGPEMRHLVAQKMIQFIKNEPRAIYFMCAQEDTHTFCNCERCQQAMREWGGTQCGLQVAFMNDVITEVEAWVADNQPDRKIQYLIFSYQYTLQPPVKTDGNGKLVPYSDKVIPHEKMRIYLAPIEANYAFTFSSPINRDFGAVLNGWSVLAKDQIIMYLYDLNYRIYFVNFNNFGTVAGMYRECKDAGCTYMLTQGVSDSNICCFDEMRSYVESNIMWNLDLHYDTLAYDFMEHFYDEAAPAMKDLYNISRDRYAYYQTLVQQSTGNTTGDLRNPQLFPFALVRQMDATIQSALAAIAPAEERDFARYQVLRNRIMKEYLSVIYLKMILYRTNYSDSEVNQMLQDWTFYTQLFGITKVGEGVDIEGVFD